MMFLCSAIRAVKLRQMTVDFCVCIDTGVILIGVVNTTDHSLSDSSRSEAVSGFKVICGKLRYHNFTHFQGTSTNRSNICCEFFLTDLFKLYRE